MRASAVPAVQMTVTQTGLWPADDISAAATMGYLKPLAEPGVGAGKVGGEMQGLPDHNYAKHVPITVLPH